jgi:hypothetical protein
MGVAFDTPPGSTSPILVYLSIVGTGSALDAVWARANDTSGILLDTPDRGKRLFKKEKRPYTRTGKYMDRLAMPHQIMLHSAITDTVSPIGDYNWLYILAPDEPLAIRRFADKLALVTKLPTFNWERELFATAKRMNFVRECQVLGNFVCYAVSTDSQAWQTLISALTRKLGLPETMPETA